MRFNSKKIQLTAVYRSPSPSVSDPDGFVSGEIEEILNYLERDAECFLVGDMNLCLMKMGAKTETYLENCTERGFTAMNDSLPTRITDGGSSLIDHVMGRLAYAANPGVTVADSKGVSDHCLVEFELEVGRCDTLKSKRVLRKTDYDRLKSKLSGMNGCTFCGEGGTDRSAEDLTEACRRFSGCTSVTEASPRYTNLMEWVTPGLTKAIRRRQRLYKKYMRTKSSQDSV